MKTGWLFRLALGLLLFAVGCSGRYDDLCAQADDCENGNDQDIEACVQQLETEEEIADLHGCEGQWDELVDCALENNTCTDDNEFRLQDDCDGEVDDYDDCVD